MLKIHKWLAISVGAFMLAWLISGILMAIPTSLLEGTMQTGRQQAASSLVDFKKLQISIPQAIAALEMELGQNIQATGVRAMRFGNGPVYEITLSDGGMRLVDALSGAPITITQAMAEEVGRSLVPKNAQILATTLMSQRDYYYWGRLPVYKIAFDDEPQTVVYVTAATGQTQHTTRLGRLRRVVVSFHEFQPLRLISESNVLRVGLLILCSVVGIGAVGAGFFLAVPVRPRPSRAMRRATLARHGE